MQVAMRSHENHTSQSHWQAAVDVISNIQEFQAFIEEIRLFTTRVHVSLTLVHMHSTHFVVKHCTQKEEDDVNIAETTTFCPLRRCRA